MKNELKIGDVVKSHYRAKWIGVIENIEYTNSCSSGMLCHVRPKITSKGKTLRKSKIMSLDSGWLTKEIDNSKGQ